MNNAAITFAGAAPVGNAYLLADCDISSANVQRGRARFVATTGALTNGAGNLVAAKCSIPPGGSARFKFVLSWWRMFVSITDRYGTGAPDSDNYYYHNFYADSKTAAQFGMQHFDDVEKGATSIVNRVMACNFPDWYRDRLLNNLYPLIQKRRVR